MIQDSNSPSHMGWQTWDGGSTIYAPTEAGISILNHGSLQFWSGWEEPKPFSEQRFR